MTMKERIGTAQYSRDLSDHPDGELGDVDIIRACGMVGVSMPLGVSLWRLKVSGDRQEYPRVVEGLIELVHKRGFTGDALVLVHRVLRHHLDDVCRTCHGRGYELVEGTPMLSDELCLACGGTGRRRLEDADEMATWVQEQIARLEREVATAIMKKLAREIDF